MKADEEMLRVKVKLMLPALRKDRGVSQGDVADGCGIKRQVICDIEGGRRRIVLSLALRLARYFSITVEQLVGSPGDVR